MWRHLKKFNFFNVLNKKNLNSDMDKVLNGCTIKKKRSISLEGKINEFIKFNIL